MQSLDASCVVRTSTRKDKRSGFIDADETDGISKLVVWFWPVQCLVEQLLSLLNRLDTRI